ncbi:type II toxin-antitoxin system prevent-host-death family antitoxin [Streptomyces sp. AMCC400023]|uniref:type II toxin-antitoxin system prevent-host-death family antitoxin n=1 Tax=Streptomyces sp. AMCC400023 TaxID=2056258 RepID=UPI001EFFCF01|nr:type II toxin-antitoxin system prevent-host-death family antitoxin [Streptomyces sp. AMCC400023]
MSKISSVEIGVRDLRASISEVLNQAVRGQITYVTSYGRRIAAIVPVVDAEAIEASRQREGTPAGESAPADS